MRIKLEHASHLFSKTIQSAAKDPLSWEKWSCVHITIEPKEGYNRIIAPHAYMLSHIGSALSDLEGTAYLCDTHNLFVMCRNASRQTLRLQLHAALTDALSDQGIGSSCTIYDVMNDWLSLQRVCESIEIQHLQAADEPEAKLFEHFNEMKDLHYILEQNMRKRRYRERLQIMLVEDDPVTCRIVGNLLRDEYDVILADTAEEAVVHYILNAPDLVFLDIGLPDHSGMDVVSSMRNSDPDAYIVMFSGNHGAENISQSMALGAKGFIEKPFRRERLFHYIHDCSLRQRDARHRMPHLYATDPMERNLS